MNNWGKDARKCNCCQRIRPIQEFGRSRFTLDHLCRTCRNEYNRDWYKRNKEKVLEAKKFRDFVLNCNPGILTLNK